MFLDINGSSTKTRVKIQHSSESKFASKNEHDKNNKKNAQLYFPIEKKRLKITKPKMQSQCIWLVTDFFYASTDSCTTIKYSGGTAVCRGITRIRNQLL